MGSIAKQPDLRAEHRKEVLSRLRRAEGQVKALTKAVEAGAECRTLVPQIKAARTALDAAGKLVLACYLGECASCSPEQQREAIDLLVKF